VISFERTSDMELVRDILTGPATWPGVCDDFAPPQLEFQPNPDPRIWYVAAIEGTQVVGLFSFLPRSTVLWEVHIALHRKGRRTHGREIAAQGLRWMFDHSPARRIVAEIPASNPLAIRLAAAVMEHVGVQARAFQKGGRLRDLIVFGLSKPAEE
jgi:RimJ/RimL family protein N-acetyltransferase